MANAALAMAIAGDLASAQKLEVELNEQYPLSTFMQDYWLPSIRAAVALQRKDPNRAIELLRVTSAIELAANALALVPAYLRGEAYLMLHDGKRAAAEFHKYIDNYGLVGAFTWGALARLGVARGLRARSRDRPCRSREGPQRVSGLPQHLEKRRSRHSHLQAGQGRVCQAEVSLCPSPRRCMSVSCRVSAHLRS